PQSDIIAHRVCYMGYFSKHNVPEGKSSLIAEVTTNKVTGNIDDSLLIEMAVNDLDKTGIINKKDVIITDIKNFEYGYVVYDMNYTRNITMIKDYFSGAGIALLGRFAEFEYINMDEVIKRARKLAEKINYEA
ncbi:MAG: FAD-dependent oxidoreductase, partial [Candidatus Eremiobacterota bacterium]